MLFEWSPNYSFTAHFAMGEESSLRRNPWCNGIRLSSVRIHHIQHLASIEESAMIPPNPCCVTGEESAEKKKKDKQILIISHLKFITNAHHILYISISNLTHRLPISDLAPSCQPIKTYFKPIITLSYIHHHHPSLISIIIETSDKHIL